MTSTKKTLAKGHIMTMKRLDQLLNGDRSTLPTKSVSTPSEQIKTLLPDGNDLNKIIEAVQSKRQTMMNDNPALWYLTVFLLASGARISEVLQLDGADITATGHVRIKGLKGSDNRIVYSGEASWYLIQCKERGKKPFADFSRNFVWRYYKKHGIGEYFGSNANRSVTHLFRHIMVLSQVNSNIDSNTRSKSVGHKSHKSTQSYEKSITTAIRGKKGNTSKPVRKER